MFRSSVEIARNARVTNRKGTGEVPCCVEMSRITACKRLHLLRAIVVETFPDAVWIQLGFRDIEIARMRVCARACVRLLYVTKRYVCVRSRVCFSVRACAVERLCACIRYRVGPTCACVHTCVYAA